MVLFQLLRPADGLATIGERLASLFAPTGLALGLVGAGLGLTVAWVAGPARRDGRWAPIALYAALGLAGFLVSRSYYQHYASQLMPALAILAGGLGAALVVSDGRPSPVPHEGKGDASRPGAAASPPPHFPASPQAPTRRLRVATLAALVALVSLATVGLTVVVAPRPDAIFATVARYIADAVPPTGAALTTDAQFNVLASRALPRAAGGYLVDSYGQLVYAGLGLDDGPLLEAAMAGWRGREGVTVDEVMWRPAAQALLREHLAAAEVVVIHAVGQRRLTPETKVWLAREFRLAETTRRYDIYRRTP